MGKIQEIIDSHEMPGITGTRDSFGIKKEFYDPKSGKYINNFKDWERAGFKSTGDITNSRIRSTASKKERKCNKRGDRAIDPANLPT